jgi:hypothetical protein
MKRLLFSFGVHLAVGLVAAGVIYLLTKDQNVLAQSIIDQLFDDPDVLVDTRKGVQSASFATLIAALGFSWVASAAFLLWSNAYRPSAGRFTGAMMGPWFFLLLVALASVGVAAWWQIWLSALNFEFNPARLTVVTIVSSLSVLIAYYLGTALSIKNELKASIPFAVFLPTLDFLS